MQIDIVSEDGSLLEEIVFDDRGRARLSYDDHRRVSRRRRYKQQFYIQRALYHEKIKRRNKVYREVLVNCDDGYKFVSVPFDVEGKPSPSFCGMFSSATNFSDDIDGKINILKNSEGQAFVGGVYRCGSVWSCPICGSSVLKNRSEEIDTIVKYFDDNPHYFGTSHYLETLTFHHKKSDTLHDMFVKFRAAQKVFATLRPMRRFLKSCAGFITTTEITYSERNGWHLHTHRLFLASSYLPDLSNAWLHSLSKVGLSGKSRVAYDLRKAYKGASEYISKTGLDDYSHTWTIGKEMSSDAKLTRHSSPNAKGMHPWDLAQTRPDLIREYYHATKGRTRIYFSRGLRAMVGLHESDEDSFSPDVLTEVVRIRQYVWTMICRHNLVPDVLECAELGGRQEVMNFIIPIVNSLDSSMIIDNDLVDSLRRDRVLRYKKR